MKEHVSEPSAERGKAHRNRQNWRRRYVRERAAELPNELGAKVRMLWRDESGIILPYVTVMLPVLIGFSALALDASRLMSLNTQLQAAADNMALAGARELNHAPGAQARANSAILKAYASTKSANTIFGFGATTLPSPTVSFYSCLPLARLGISDSAFTTAGCAAITNTTDFVDPIFVRVTMARQTEPTIMPVGFLNAIFGNSFSSNAVAVAGFKGISICGVAPMYVCNPYETAGMTDAEATDALYTAFADQNTLRKQYKLCRKSCPDGNISGPGHFGLLADADNCHNTPCIRDAFANLNPNVCYNQPGVNLSPGNHGPGVEAYLDVRFDIPTANFTSSDPPAVNVRKGYYPKKTANAADWCNSNPQAQQFGGSVTGPYLTYPSNRTTGNVANTSTAVTVVASTTGVVSGEPIVDRSGYLNSTGATAATTNTVSSVAGTTVNVANPATNSQPGDNLTIEWTTTGLPEDTAFPNFSGLGGNGQWDCANYWAISHPGVAAPTSITMPGSITVSGTCGTPAATTFTRYQIYRYEIGQGTGSGGINDWSGRNGWSSNGQTDAPSISNPSGRYQTENGAPYCAAQSSVSGVDISTGGVDRRNIIVPYVNCLAQSISGGATANNVPVAAFGKYFMTQPYSIGLPGGYLVGEVSGLVSSLDNVTLFNMVQLYR